MSIPADAHAFERWLRTPWRRILLVVASVLLLAGASTLLMADAMADLDRDLDLWLAFRRRLISWSLWGLCFEPLLWLSAQLPKIVKPVGLIVLTHAVLSVLCALGLREVDLTLGEAWSPGDPAGAFERGAGPGSAPPGPGRRADRPERPERDRAEEFRPDRPSLEPGSEERLDRRGGTWAGRPRTWQRRSRHRLIESNVILYWLIVGLGLALRSYVSHRDQERRATGLELRTTRLEGELTTARLAQLEAQLHPHFLFNALHSVGGLIRDGQRETALSTLSALGDLLRATLQHGVSGEVLFGDEVDLVEAYLDVERIRLGDRLEADLEIDLSATSVPVPPLLLLPLVENSIKHAVANRPEGGRIELLARREDDKLLITLSDDGPGFPAEILAGEAPGEGIGLSNTRSRIQALYGEDAIQIENSSGNGARVVIQIPIDD